MAFPKACIISDKVVISQLGWQRLLSGKYIDHVTQLLQIEVALGSQLQIFLKMIGRYDF
jgi:hypothetical protein